MYVCSTRESQSEGGDTILPSGSPSLKGATALLLESSNLTGRHNSVFMGTQKKRNCNRVRNSWPRLLCCPVRQGEHGGWVRHLGSEEAQAVKGSDG